MNRQHDGLPPEILRQIAPWVSGLHRPRPTPKPLQHQRHNGSAHGGPKALSVYGVTYKLRRTGYDRGQGLMAYDADGNPMGYGSTRAEVTRAVRTKVLEQRAAAREARS